MKPFSHIPVCSFSRILGLLLYSPHSVSQIHMAGNESIYRHTDSLISLAAVPSYPEISQKRTHISLQRKLFSLDLIANPIANPNAWERAKLVTCHQVPFDVIRDPLTCAQIPHNIKTELTACEV